MRITDVFHAVQYLDVVMEALGWDEATRQTHRRTWYRGEVNARDWLKDYLPEPELWLNWPEDAQTALSYIDTRLDSMDYALVASQGLPIGSGQVEAMNKSVIGHRMKRSGMHWSKSGAAAMALSSTLIGLSSVRKVQVKPIMSSVSTTPSGSAARDISGKRSPSLKSSRTTLGLSGCSSTTTTNHYFEGTT